MTAYSYVLLDWNDIVAGPPQCIEADTPSGAIESALVILHAQPQYSGVELWDQDRRIYPVRGRSDIASRRGL